MTVAIAAICSWNYTIGDAPPDYGSAVIAVSDRMFTSPMNVEYEPLMFKRAQITKNVVILIAGDITIHSQILVELLGDVKNKPEANTSEIADLYGAHLRNIRNSIAEHKVLSRYNLTYESFIEKQKYMDRDIVSELHNDVVDIQNSIDVEALVIGVDSNRTANIYHIDKSGTKRCFSDIGFAAIGIGSEQANFQFMQRGYSNTRSFFQSLWISYFAKKCAEVAPGVGKATDVAYILADATFPLQEGAIENLENVYADFEKSRKSLETELVEKLLSKERSRTASSSELNQPDVVASEIPKAAA